MENDAVEQLRARLAKVLVGFSAEVPDGIDAWGMQSFKPSMEEFPLPALVLFLFRDVLGYRWSGRGEKVAWSIYLLFQGASVVLEHRKFGFTVCHEKDAELDFDRLKGQLSCALKILEKKLESVAEEQIAVGNVTLANHHYEFVDRYEFYRAAAEASFEAGRLPTPNAEGGTADVIELLNTSHKHMRAGFYHTIAMVDAYFGLLEHRMNLLRAFQGSPVEQGGLKAFLCSNWSEKFLAILGGAVSDKAGQLLGQLREIKERLRNPMTHGGTENDGSSLHVHIPSIGALPATFSGVRESIRFRHFEPVSEDSFQRMVTTFDEFDEFLSSGPLSKAYKMLDAGLDGAFDEKSLGRYRQLVEGSQESLEAYIEGWLQHRDQVVNMDF